MMKLILITMTIGIFTTLFAGEKIKTIPKSKPDYYESISSLTEGPTIWIELSDEEYESANSDIIVGRTFRIVVLTSEIYSTVFIEEITQGIEGCCKKLSSIRKLDLLDFAKKFKLTGEISGFKVIKWESSTSLLFSLNEREFLISDLNKEIVTIKEKR